MSLRRNESSPSEDVGPLDVVAAAAFALLAGGLFAATLQVRMYGDAPGLVDMVHSGRLDRYGHHPLYLPTMDLLGSIVPLPGTLAAPKLLSVLGGAIGVGATYLLARGFGALRLPAVLATLLLAVTPAVWFFATTIEVPALHFGATASAACVALFASWRKPAQALLASALFFPLAYLTHQTGVLLGPGWVALVACARARSGGRPSWGKSLLVDGPVLLAALLFAMAGASWWIEGEFRIDLGGEVSVIETFSQGTPLEQFLWRGWLAPLALLVPAALLGLAAARRAPLVVGTLALLVGVPFAFFAWWTVAERGGYFLQTAPFYASLAALALGSPRIPPRVLLGLGLVAIATQATIARRSIDAWDVGFEPDERARVVREVLGDEGFLLTAHPAAPPIRLDLPGVIEIDVTQAYVIRSVAAGLTAEQFAASLPEVLAHDLAGQRFALDLSYEKVRVNHEVDPLKEYLAAGIEALRERYTVTEHPHPSWTLLLFEP